LINAQVQSRLQLSSGSYASAIADPSLRTNQGIRTLAAAATREANVLAYNDIFMMIALIAVLTLIWIFLRSLWLKMTTEKIAPAPTTTSSDPSSGAELS